MLSMEEILDELIAPLGIPAIANVPVGHGRHMATIPLGATGTKSTATRRPSRSSRQGLADGARHSWTDDTVRGYDEVCEDSACARGAVGGLGRAGDAPGRPGRRTRAGQRIRGRLQDRLVPGSQDAQPLRRRQRGGVHDLGDQLGAARGLRSREPHPGSGDRGIVGRLRGRQDSHLPPDRGREVVRRRADHVRGRQMVARDARRGGPALHRLHHRRPVDQDARRAHGRPHQQGAQRPPDRRPLRLHPARAHLGQGAGGRAHRRLPAEGAAGRQRPLHRHRVRAEPDPEDDAEPGVARRASPPSTSSSSSATAAPTRSSAPSPSARSTSSPRYSRRPSTGSASRRGSRS